MSTRRFHRLVGQMVLLTVGLPPLQAEWRIEELGIPVNAVNYENTGGVLAAGPGGQGRMFYTSYYRSTGAELVGYDFRSGALSRKKLPARGGYGLSVGLDGAVYVGGVSPGDMYRYEPQTDTLTTLSAKQFGVQYIWDADTASDGTIYAAAGYPKTRLVAFKPGQAEGQDLGEMVPGQQYLRSVCVDAFDKVWCGIGTQAHLVVYDPSDGGKRSMLPEQYASNSSVYHLEAVGKYVVAALLFDGVLLVFDAESQELLRAVDRPQGQKSWMISAGGHDATTYLWTLPNMDLFRCNLEDGSSTRLAEALGQVKVVEEDRWAHAMDDQSYLAYDLLENREVARRQLTAEGEGMDVFALTNGADGNIYGSTYINMHMFRCDAADGTLTDLGKVSRWAGQVDSLSLGRDGRIYIGAYTDAVICIYDPGLSWRPGLKADSNPREIGPVGKGQYRTRANCLGPDGRIYVGSIPAYRSAETGAFTICDPRTGRMDVRTDFVKGGTVDALVSDEQYVYGAGGGEFFAYDPARNEKHFEEKRSAISLAVLSNGKVIGSGGGRLFLYDHQSNRIVKDEANTFGDFTHLASGADGVYAVNAGHIARIRPDMSVEVLSTLGGKFAALDNQGRVYFARGPKLFRCSPQ